MREQMNNNKADTGWVDQGKKEINLDLILLILEGIKPDLTINQSLVWMLHRVSSVMVAVYINISIYVFHET